MIPVQVIRPIAEAWVAEHESAEVAFQVLSTSTGLSADAWRKRFTELTYRGRTGMELPLGWWSHVALDEESVDEFLSAAGLTHLWYEEPLIEYHGVSVGLHCEDCAQPIAAGDYMPLDLMRADPSASRWVWDSTKNKPVFRPKNAKPGGRRFRRVDLCGRCATLALLAREPIYRRGRLSVPKRGGRPRLLNEEQLRVLYRVYETRGFSIQRLARMLVDANKIDGTFQGFYQSILYGWRKLGLELRPRGVQIAMSRFGTDGTRSRAWKKRCGESLGDGRRCTQFVRRVVTDTGSSPAPDGLCWNHGVGSRAARQRSAVAA